MVHWFFDTAGIGSLIVIVVAVSVLTAYYRMLRWIQTTPPDVKEADVEPAADKAP